MENVTQMLRQGRHDEVWNRYCGFLHLTVEEFMEIQVRLLFEQIDRLVNCELGRKLLRGRAPRTLEEFREVPLTQYEDYAEVLLERREDVLPEKPFMWLHTSGRSGEYPYKWYPYTRTMYEMGGQAGLACFILSAAAGKGHVALQPNDTSLYSLAPPPYISGLLLEATREHFDFHYVPDAEQAARMDFQERIELGFNLALSEGLDFFYGISSILLKVTERFSQSRRTGNGSARGGLGLLKNPRVLWRLARAFVRSRLHGRALLPRDIWQVKGVLCGGTDTSIFKDEVERSWGRVPLEVYASTEFGITATQAWNHSGMTFLPFADFWEFLPEPEYRKFVHNRSYQPRTLLLNEVQPDQEYVMVGTSFHGGALVRFVLSDLIKIISLEDPSTGVRLPQMVFCTRVDDIIDIGGFTRLTEKTLWQALENSGVEYVEWTTRKEYRDRKPVLKFYLELKDSYSPDRAAERIHQSLKELNEPYRELEAMAGLSPLQVAPLSKGTFMRYYQERQASGADLAHLKPPHVNPTDGVVRELIRMSEWRI